VNKTENRPAKPPVSTAFGGIKTGLQPYELEAAMQNQAGIRHKKRMNVQSERSALRGLEQGGAPQRVKSCRGNFLACG